MLTREIQLDTEGAPVTLNPRWLRIQATVKHSGLSRSRLYELLSEGSIRSICIKSQKWAQRGVRTFAAAKVFGIHLRTAFPPISRAPRGVTVSRLVQNLKK